MLKKLGMREKKRMILIGFIMIIFSSQAIWVTYSPVISKVAHDMNTHMKNVGFLAVTYPIFFLLLTVPSGIMLDKNFRRGFMFGVLMTTLSSVGRLIYNEWWWILTFQIFGAVGQPFLLNSFVPFSSRMFPEKKSLILSILSLSMYGGAVFSLISGVKIYEIGGLKALSLPSALISIIGTILIFSSSIPNYHQTNSSKFGLEYVIRSKDLYIIGAVLGLGVATFDNLATWLEPVLKSEGLENIAGRSVGVSIIAGLIGITFIPKKISEKNIRTIYLRTIIPIIGIFFVIMSMKINEPFVFLSLSISGFLMLPAYPIIMDWIAKFHSPEHLGRASSFVGLISRIIAVILTVSASSFISSTKNYFTFLLISITLAFIAALMMPNDRNKNYKDQ